ncbi:unnamed protein product [Pleuronectes platessa]|uniref:Uncharacterized protein n=1 Tax=Pleuronectes platessa TaxID=8262 RepID=A0A9N7UF15_PLEPL|nr:unnamed protein product [Pleuronectes platessa]
MSVYCTSCAHKPSARPRPPHSHLFPKFHFTKLSRPNLPLCVCLPHPYSSITPFSPPSSRSRQLQVSGFTRSPETIECGTKRETWSHLTLLVASRCDTTTLTSGARPQHHDTVTDVSCFGGGRNTDTGAAHLSLRATDRPTEE